MAKRAANRKKVWAMCYKALCNVWLFARLESDAPAAAGYILMCTKHGGIFSR